MATFTNKAKNSITPISQRKGGYAFWGDSIVTWGDIGYGWGSPYSTFSNKAKNTLTPINKSKS